MKVFVKTKQKFEASVEKATAFINENLNEIKKKEQEIKETKEVNTALESQIKHMTGSIKQIDTIINPAKEKSGEEKQ